MDNNIVIYNILNTFTTMNTKKFTTVQHGDVLYFVSACGLFTRVVETIDATSIYVRNGFGEIVRYDVNNVLDCCFMMSDNTLAHHVGDNTMYYVCTTKEAVKQFADNIVSCLANCL